MDAVFAALCEKFDGGKCHASVMRISVGTNVCHICDKYGDSLVSLTICSTKKEAQRIADVWNETYRKYGSLQEFTELTVKVRKEGMK